MDSSGPYRSQPPSGPRKTEETVCPGCLSRVQASLRRCGTCGTPIATVRCASCFHMNLPQDASCAGCGRELGLEPLPEPDHLLCPDCRQPFQAFAGGPGLLHDCAACGGQFVDHALLKDLLEGRETYGKSAPRPPQRHNPLESPLRYVACPSCQQIMTRRNFGRSSGVIVDICVAHGVWFDRGELPRVLAFVESGGLELLRQRETDQQREALRRGRVGAAEQLQGLHAPAHGFGQFDSTQRGIELAEAAGSLLVFVAGLLAER